MISSNDGKTNSSKLIVIVIKKGNGSKIVEIAKKAGADGGTIVLGRGTAERSIYESILGIDYEPEKEIVLIAVRDELEDQVLDSVTKEGQLNRPGKGIGFVLDLKECLGIAHMLANL